MGRETERREKYPHSCPQRCVGSPVLPIHSDVVRFIYLFFLFWPFRQMSGGGVLIRFLFGRQSRLFFHVLIPTYASRVVKWEPNHLCLLVSSGCSLYIVNSRTWSYRHVYTCHPVFSLSFHLPHTTLHRANTVNFTLSVFPSTGISSVLLCLISSRRSHF